MLDLLEDEYIPQYPIACAPPRDAKYQATSQYVTQLKSVIGYYTGWIPQEYADNISEDDGYSILARDEAIYHALELLSLFSCGEYFSIRGSDPRLRKICKWAMSGIRDFYHARKSLVQKGTLFGLALQRKYWRWAWKDGLLWQVPYMLKEVDRRRLRIERDPQDRTRTYWTIWDLELDRYVELADRDVEPDYHPDYQLQQYVWYFYEQEELSPYYAGIGEQLFRLAYIKSKVLQYWARLCECWSEPYVIVKMNPNKGVFSSSPSGGGFTNARTRADRIIDTVEKMVARHCLVVTDQNDEVTIQEHGSTGNNILKEFLGYADQRINHLILGAELTTNTGEGVGSYAMAQIHRGATQAKVIYNRNRIEERYTEDLLMDFCYRNAENLERLGIPFPQPGELRMRFKVKSEEVKKKILEGGGGDGKVSSTELKLADTMGA